MKELESQLKKIIETTFPKLESGKKVWWMALPNRGCQGAFFVVCFVYKTHVTIEFATGYLLSDPKNILEGTGKFRRHLKFKKEKDIPKTYLVKLLKEAAKTQ